MVGVREMVSTRIIDIRPIASAPKKEVDPSSE